nr:MAG TPA: hypothetical protein [Caudoviricetes sp.]
MPGSIWWLDNGPISKFSPNSYIALSHKPTHKPRLSTSARR